MPTRAEFDALKVNLAQAITDLSVRVQALVDKANNGVPLTDQDSTDVQAAIDAVKALAA